MKVEMLLRKLIIRYTIKILLQVICRQKEKVLSLFQLNCFNL